MEEKKRLKRYKISKYQDRLAELDSDGENSVLNLREELALARIVLEEIFNQCGTTNDLLTFSNQIDTYLNRVQRMVESCFKLEKMLGNMLTKEQLLTFAEGIITDISEVLADQPDLIDAIGLKIMERVDNVADQIPLEAED